MDEFRSEKQVLEFWRGTGLRLAVGAAPELMSERSTLKPGRLKLGHLGLR